MICILSSKDLNHFKTCQWDHSQYLLHNQVVVVVVVNTFTDHGLHLSSPVGLRMPFTGVFTLKQHPYGQWIEFLEAWIPTINDNCLLAQWAFKETKSTQNNRDQIPPVTNNYTEDRNTSMNNNHGDTNGAAQTVESNTWWKTAVSHRNDVIHIKVTTHISW